jgi:hypothetical protein
MDLQQREDGFSSENRPCGAGPAVVLEPTSLRLRVLGLGIELSGSTTPQSPESLAACLLLDVMAMLGLSCGLGGLCHWLGGPLWLCLAAPVAHFICIAERPGYYLGLRSRPTRAQPADLCPALNIVQATMSFAYRSSAEIMSTSAYSRYSSTL